MNKLIKINNILRNPRKIIKYIAAKGWLNFFNDKLYLKILYYSRIGKRLNLKNPTTFNEKLQWLKIYDRNPLYTRLADKYEVRKYIEEKIGEEFLIPLISVYNSVDEIKFENLPNKFVLKTTHDSGGIIVCTDKNNIDEKYIRYKLNKSLKKNYFYHGREWPYKDIKPRIICEKYMEDTNSKDLKDYKFMCFNGKVKCILVCSERNSSEGVKMDFYDDKWKIINMRRYGRRSSNELIIRPKNLEKMIEISEELSSEIAFLRVDFYEINDKLYFGELTFYPASGMDKFEPENYDDILGTWLNIDSDNY